MIIDKNLRDYIVFSEDCITRALKKIGRNKHRFILAVNQSGVLQGIMTDGDFRRERRSFLAEDLELRRPMKIHETAYTIREVLLPQ